MRSSLAHDDTLPKIGVVPSPRSTTLKAAGFCAEVTMPWKALMLSSAIDEVLQLGLAPRSLRAQGGTLPQVTLLWHTFPFQHGSIVLSLLHVEATPQLLTN